MSPTSTKLLAAIALAVTFFVGAVVGGVDRIMVLHGIGMSGPSAEFLVRRLDRRLHFSAEQRAQVVAIVNRRQKRIVAVWPRSVRRSIRRSKRRTSRSIAC